MDIVVNGRTREMPDGSTVADLIGILGLRERNVVVERNGEALDRRRFESAALVAGDVLEVVRPVQGG